MRLPIRLPQTAELARHLESALAPTDKLLWSGQPSGLGGSPRTHLLAAACALLSWVLGAGVVNGSVGDGGFHWGYAFAGGSVAALAVLALYAGLLWMVRSTTIYGLTADAAIIRTAIPWRRTILIDLKTMQHLHLELGTHDSGTISFGVPTTGPRQARPPAFVRVRHARRVFDLARGSGAKPVESGLNFSETATDPGAEPL